MVFTSIRSARRATSDASAMTSGELLATARRSSWRASISPPSAALESVCSRSIFVSSSSRSSISALTPSPPFSLVPVTAGRYQVRPGEGFRHLVELHYRRGDLRPPPGGLRLPAFPLLGVDAGG